MQAREKIEKKGVEVWVLNRKVDTYVHQADTEGGDPTPAAVRGDFLSRPQLFHGELRRRRRQLFREGVLPGFAMTSAIEIGSCNPFSLLYG